MRFDLQNWEMEESSIHVASKTNELLDILESWTPNEDVRNLPSGPSIEFGFSVLRNVFVLRMLDQGEAIVREWQGSHWVMMVTAARGTIETCAFAHRLFSRIESAAHLRDADKCHELIMSGLFPTRSANAIKTGSVPAVNILTMLEQFEKAVDGILRCHAAASEIVHPNASGLFKMYANADYEQDTIQFSRTTLQPLETFGHVVFANRSLEAAIEKIESLEKIQPKLAILARSLS